MNAKTILLATGILLSGLSSSAQKDSALSAEAINKMKEKFWLIKNNKIPDTQKEKVKKEFDQTLEKAVVQANQELKTFITKMQQEDARLQSAYRPGYNHKSGEMNLFPIWEDIPSPVPSLPESKQVNFKDKYGAYIDRIIVMKKQLGDMQKQHLDMQRSSKAEIMDDSKKMANKSAVVQQMGGADALMNMTDAQRAAAAKNVRETAQNNPAAFAGVKDPGMNAMMQKMMNDPAYRAKFSKMTEAQKQAEMQSYMMHNTVARDDNAYNNAMQERDKTIDAQNVQLLLGKTLTNMQEAANPYTRGTELANEFYDRVYKSLAVWYQANYDALPLKAVGESLEKEGVHELDVFTEFLRYKIEQMEAATRIILWAGLKVRTKIAFGEFNDFVGSFPWGKTKNASLVDGSYTEIHVANAVSSIYDDMIAKTKDAEMLTKKHKGQQEQFELMMK